MGYDLHITRAADWTDSETHPITLEHWSACVAADPSLEMVGVAETATPDGHILRYENPGLAIWQAHPEGHKVWFDWRRGRVVVKNPDEPTIEKMLALAAKLGARVEGDEGEIYEAPGVPRMPRVRFRDRLAAWFARLRPRPKLAPIVLPFAVGNRVRDVLGRTCTVSAIELEAENGLGKIRVRYDDGRDASFAAIAHGLTLIE